MTYWRRLLVAGIGALSLVGGSMVSAAADENGTVITFNSMTAIAGPLVGAVNDRGLTGGGIRWRIASGSGSVDRHGHVSATVMGLVLDDGARAGTNPIGTFAATVSCRTTAQEIVNVQTAGFPASAAGNSTIIATVDLPHPCTVPEVFVGGLISAPAGQVFRWFAVSNGDFHDAS